MIILSSGDNSPVAPDDTIKVRPTGGHLKGKIFAKFPGNDQLTKKAKMVTGLPERSMRIVMEIPDSLPSGVRNYV
jgi:hypothetical protein